MTTRTKLAEATATKRKGSELDKGIGIARRLAAVLEGLARVNATAYFDIGNDRIGPMQIALNDQKDAGALGRVVEVIGAVRRADAKPGDAVAHRDDFQTKLGGVEVRYHYGSFETHLCYVTAPIATFDALGIAQVRKDDESA